MSTYTVVTCEWCTDTLELQDIELSCEQGWLEVAQMDNTDDEIKRKDFCSVECLVSYYG